MRTAQKPNAVFDFFKLGLSALIVLLHTSSISDEPYLLVFYPWVRLAVPLFFMLSAYFFFSKITRCESWSEKTASYRRFAIRNLKLYGFWFVVLLPITIITHDWAHEGNGIGIAFRFLREFLFHETFWASWFIMALIISVGLVLLMSRAFSSRLIITITLFVYLLVCLKSSYSSIIYSHFSLMAAAFEKYESIFLSIVNSFPAGLFWVAVGKAFAEKQNRWSNGANGILFASGVVLLFAEWYCLKKIDGHFKNDFYVMLIPVCLAIFNWILHLPPKESSYGLPCRKASTIIYTTHFSVAVMLQRFFDIYGKTISFLPLFAITIMICVSITTIILLVAKNDLFRWLNAAY